MSDRNKMPYEEVKDLIGSVKDCIELLDGTDSWCFELKDLVQLVRVSNRLIKSCEDHIGELFPDFKELEKEMETKEAGKIELTKDEINMIREELKYSRCLIWDDKLELNDYCNGDECHQCGDRFTVDKWLRMKGV